MLEEQEIMLDQRGCEKKGRGRGSDQGKVEGNVILNRRVGVTKLDDKDKESELPHGDLQDCFSFSLYYNSLIIIFASLLGL